MMNAKWGGLSSIAILGGILLSLVGCDSEEKDHTPPEHSLTLQKSSGKYRFGITDTITISFSEKIDTSALALDFKPPEGIAHKFVGGTKLLIYGNNTTFETGHFFINSPFTVVLTGLKDLHGNNQIGIEESFQPYPWVDRDPIDTSVDGYDSLFASTTTWVDGSPISDSIIFEGCLDFKKLSGIPDYIDMKVVSVTGGDTLVTTLTTRKDVNLVFKVAGPYTQAGLDSLLLSDKLDSTVVSLQTGAKGVAGAKIPAELAEYKRKFKDPGAQGLYLIYIEIPQGKEGFYRLGARIHTFK